jgi:hypothetical protein
MKKTEIKPHECIIGQLLSYENTRLVTEQELVEDIEWRSGIVTFGRAKLSFADYCDFRQSLDLVRFKYCPDCGEKIDWKAMKRRNI